MHRTLLVADSGSKIPPTDLLGAVSFSTKTLSNSGINRFDIAVGRRLKPNRALNYLSKPCNPAHQAFDKFPGDGDC